LLLKFGEYADWTVHISSSFPLVYGAFWQIGSANRRYRSVSLTEVRQQWLTRISDTDVTIVTHFGHLNELSFQNLPPIDQSSVGHGGDNRPMADQAKLRPDGVELPLPRRLNSDHPRFATIMTLHRDAVHRQRPTYRDPLSGYTVFTAKFLADRDYCCASGCRHCPYEQLP
jgi:hypothetical protein